MASHADFQESTVPLERVTDETLLQEAKAVVRLEKSRWKEQKESQRGKSALTKTLDWIGLFIPFFSWIRVYQWRSWLLPDLAAGLSVAAMVVPQGMSYAQNLAFLPQVYGLYGAFTPCIFYSLLGSSKQAAVGPVAVTSLILGSGLSNIYGKFAVNPSDPEHALIAYKQQQYNVGAIQVAFLAGVFYTSVGLFRLGFVLRILSHPMISGFMSGASLIIASGQVKYLAMQMSLPRSDTLQGSLYYVFTPQPNPKVWPPAPYPFQWRQFVIFTCFLLGLGIIQLTFFLLNRRVFKRKYGDSPPFFIRHLPFLVACVWAILNIFIMCWIVAHKIKPDDTPWKWRETAMGGSFVLLLYMIKYISKNIRRLAFLQFLGPLIVCVISIIIMNAGKLYVTNPDNPNTPYIKPVGNIPKGLPPVTVSWWFPLYDVGQMIALALLICLIDLCESVSIAKSLAQKNHYRLDGTQELRGLGIANIAGACFNCYTTTGSFSRSAVNDSVGAKTPLAQMVCGFTVMLVLLWLTPIFEHMSANVQGAIIIWGILPLCQPQEGYKLWFVNKFDWLVWMTGLLITAFAGVEKGVIASVAISVVLLLVTQFFPKMRQVSAVPGTHDYRNPKLYPEATSQSPAAVVVAVEGGITFVNSEAVKEYIRDRLEKAQEETPAGQRPPRFAVLDLSTVSTMDSTAIHVFSDFLKELHKNYEATLLLANPNMEVAKQLKRGGLIAKLGPQNIHASVAHAVSAAEAADALASAISAKPSSDSNDSAPTPDRSSTEHAIDKAEKADAGLPLNGTNHAA